MKATGSISCHYGTTLTFNPPLSEGLGKVEPTGAVETITGTPATLSGCTGSATPGVPSGGTGTKTLVYKWKGKIVGPDHDTKNYVGGCTFLNGFDFPSKVVDYNWATGSGLKPTSTVTPGSLSPDGSGYSVGGAPRSVRGGSFFDSALGTATITAEFTSTGADALATCLAAPPGATGTGPTISSLTVDPTTSSITLGS
ncbi:MAG: hypothetical protein ABSB09_07225 [Acidimicrobiales bacterium]